MFPNKLYEIGQNLGLNKKDVESVLSTTPANERDIKSIPPTEIYKEFGKYGTVSIHDFSRAKGYREYDSK